MESFTLNLKNYSKKLIEALSRTFDQAKQFRYEFITPEMLLYNIVTQPEFIKFCRSKNIDQKAIVNILENHNSEQETIPPESENESMVSSQMFKLVAIINQEAKLRRKYLRTNKESSFISETLSVVDIVFYITKLDNSLAKEVILRFLGESPEKWVAELFNFYEEDISELIESKKLMEHRLEGSDEMPVEANPTTETPVVPPIHQTDNLWRQFVTCITDQDLFSHEIIGREKELSRIMRILIRKDKNNPLLLGEPGVGKTSLVYGLARLLTRNEAIYDLHNTRIYTLDMGKIVAGTNMHGEFEKRMKCVLEGISNESRSILFIDDMHLLAEIGGNNSTMNAADLVIPYIEAGKVKIIGTTTYSQYKRTIANKKALERHLGIIEIKEPEVEEAIKMVWKVIYRYEVHHKVNYTEEAVRYAVEQSHALITDRFLPDKAFDILDEAGAYRQQHPLLNKQGMPKRFRYQYIDKELVKIILADVCRIDAKLLSDNRNDELRDLDKRICNEIYGQDEAVRQVVRSVFMSKAGLNEPDKPIASLLFVGPTGVGKTELCKVLAKELGIKLLRFDMSEYTEKHTISKFIGSPAGYVGYEDGGLLTDAIRRTPNCVLLLDEIEKAHPDIYNILLQVMDYANLTDNKGNRADFKNVIIVMTSNAGAQFANQASIGFTGGESKVKAMLNTVKKTFKPEFLNRLSGTVLFNEMDITMASMILDKKLRQLAKRLEAKAVTFTLDEDVRQFLLSKGFTKQYGAREMDRVISRYLSSLFIDEILFGKLRDGGKAIITLKDGIPAMIIEKKSK